MAAEVQSTSPAPAPASAGGVSSWLPWILFGVLSYFNRWELAVVLGLLTSLYPTVKPLVRGGTAKLIDWTAVAFFVIGVVWVMVAGVGDFPEYSLPLVWLMFAGMAWGSILFGTPFTLQFAREATPREFWNNPEFLRINLVITLAWAGAFTVDLACALALTNPTGISTLMWIISAVTLGGAWIFTRRYAAAAQARAREMMNP